jgi:hypothetical protein
MSEAVGADFEINVDVTEVNAWDGQSAPLIDPGVYVLQIVDAESTSSKQNQPVLKVEFEVMNEGQFLGTKFKRSYSLQKQALSRYKNLVVACGAPLSGAKKADFVGAFISAEIVHKPGQALPQPDGSMGEPKMMMDVINEQQVAGEADDTAAAEAQAKAEAEAKAKADAEAKAKATNGAATAKAPVRRAAAATAKA